MQAERTLLLNWSDVEQLLDLRDCVDAVEEIFRLQGNGKIPASEILGVKAPGGGLHVKAVLLPRERNYFVAKLNTNFPGNRTQSSLPSSSCASGAMPNPPPNEAVLAKLNRHEFCWMKISRLSAEIRSGGETSESVQALAAIFAAHLAGVLATAPAGVAEPAPTVELEQPKAAAANS